MTTHLKLLPALCPVCHHTIAAPFFDGGTQPLATLGWPDSAAAAVTMARLPLDFIQCPRCTHVWNRAFVYEAIPYRQNPNRMFNTGTIWRGHLQFTTASFRTLLARAGEVVELNHGYDGEVVYGLVRLGVAGTLKSCARAAAVFAQTARESHRRISQQLDELATSGKAVALWGGTGKAAAFIHQFGADALRFPLVVDSDPDKAGSFVPKTGQEIRFRDVLKTQRVDVVIIPTQWRAKDIVLEMAHAGIAPTQVLIEHDGGLIDFHHAAHPYR